jgi:hypothetical protein
VSAVEEIHEAINIYNRVVDDREFDGLRAIFDAETRYWLHDQLLTGVDAAIAGLQMNFHDGRSTRHFTANTSITDITDTSASGVADLFFMEPRDGIWVTTIIGRYHDRFSHKDGRWVFAERRISYVDIPKST